MYIYATANQETAANGNRDNLEMHISTMSTRSAVHDVLVVLICGMNVRVVTGAVCANGCLAVVVVAVVVVAIVVVALVVVVVVVVVVVIVVTVQMRSTFMG